MAKVGRAARVASRQRTEIITGNKTIASAETGELYLINYNAAAGISITLPAAQEGAYFRFQFMSEMSNGAAQVDIVASGAATMKGTILNVVYHAANDTEVRTRKDDGTDTKVEFTDVTHVGSYIDVYCDGTNWQVSGVAIATAGATAVFA